MSSGSALDFCTSLSLVCVSPRYNYDTFCSHKVNASAETCRTFQRHFNHCYEGACVDGVVVAQKRSNATEKELSMRNGCVHYVCENDTGNMLENLICEERQCYTGICDNSSGNCSYEKIPGYDELIDQQNECYEIVCKDDLWVVQPRDDAEKWKKRTNKCAEYQCNNESGLLSWSMCNSTNSISRMCVSDQCIDTSTDVPSEQHFYVEIEMDVGVNVSEMDSGEILEIISQQLGVDTSEVRVAWEVDEEGYVIRVVVFVNDEETAKVIASGIDDMKKGDNCEGGVFCKSRRVTVVQNDFDGSTSVHDIKLTLFSVFLLFFCLLQFHSA